MRMPPLPADSIHARACKLKCEKILTRPQIEKVSVLISEQGEIPVFYQAAGKTQLLKRLIVGKDQAAGKVFARKRGRTPARSLL